MAWWLARVAGGVRARSAALTDFKRLPRNRDALVYGHVLQGAHIMQAVGELDDDDAPILGHRDKHRAQVLRLLVALVRLDWLRGRQRHPRLIHLTLQLGLPQL